MSMCNLSIPLFWVCFCEVDPSFEIIGRILEVDADDCHDTARIARMFCCR